MRISSDPGRHPIYDPAAASSYADAEASENPTRRDGGLTSFLQSGEASAEGWELAGVVAGLVALGVAAGVLGLTGL
jgi:hypothetical protein